MQGIDEVSDVDDGRRWLGADFDLFGHDRCCSATHADILIVDRVQVKPADLHSGRIAPHFLNFPF
jgi:hypothetical protein